MKTYIFYVLLLFTFLHRFQAKAQRTVEIGIKPVEFALLNFELNVAVGNERARYGAYVGYRPATEGSGEVSTIGHGAYGGYGSCNALNKLYNSYTIGLYYKRYLLQKQKIYAELDVYYRNWNFSDKQASFENIEGYSFDGVRTENVDVYGLKLVGGKTIYLTKKDKKIKPYLDVYAGVGLRHQEDSYETRNGTVDDTYYAYRKDHFSYNFLTPQVGLKLGLMITK